MRFSSGEWHDARLGTDSLKARRLCTCIIHIKPSPPRLCSIQTFVSLDVSMQPRRAFIHPWQIMAICSCFKLTCSLQIQNPCARGCSLRLLLLCGGRRLVLRPKQCAHEGQLHVCADRMRAYLFLNSRARNLYTFHFMA